MEKEWRHMKKSKSEELQEILKAWFSNARSYLPVRGVILWQKAQHIARKQRDWQFQCIYWVVQSFKKHTQFGMQNYACRQLKCWSRHRWRLETKVQVCCRICSHTFLVWMREIKKLCFKGESFHGRKQTKLQFTVLPFVNGYGTEKVQQWVTAKCRNQICFKQTKQMPTKYTANSRAWMTSKICENELHSLDTQIWKNLPFLVCYPAHPPNM
jgi:hypothetical protein